MLSRGTDILADVDDVVPFMTPSEKVTPAYFAYSCLFELICDRSRHLDQIITK